MSWNEILEGNNNNNGGEKVEVKFTKLAVGVTKGRILSEAPYSRWTHWIPQANGGRGQGVDCPGKDCPICSQIKTDKAANVKSKYNSTKSHAVNFLNHNTNQVEILDKGNKIFGQIAAIFQQMGDPRNYDITITRQGEDLGSINYTTLPVFPPAQLPADKAELAKNLYNIEEIRKPLTKEQILGLMSGKSLADMVATNTENNEVASDETLSIDFTAGMQR